MAVRAAELTVGGRSFRSVVIGGGRDDLTWRANVSADQLNGYVEYRQPSPAGAGRVYARLAHLTIEPSAATDVEAVLDQQPASIPALDIVVEDFGVRGKKLGRVEVEAINRGGSTGRRRGARMALQQVQCSRAGSNLHSDRQLGGRQSVAGRCRGSRDPQRPADDRRRTTMNFKLAMGDSGTLLERFGMKGVIRAARASSKARWPGPARPCRRTFRRLAGSSM